MTKPDDTDPAIENAFEDAAKAAFIKAQSVYRNDHDHIPLKATWETTSETVRDGWRAIAHAAIEAGLMPPLGTQPDPRMSRRDAIVGYLSSDTKPDENGWRPIETAPKDGTQVLTYRAAGFIAVAEYLNDSRGFAWCILDGMPIVNVTHWQPLPKPPVTP